MVFPERHVKHLVQFVLDVPVSAHADYAIFGAMRVHEVVAADLLTSAAGSALVFAPGLLLLADLLGLVPIPRAKFKHEFPLPRSTNARGNAIGENLRR